MKRTPKIGFKWAEYHYKELGTKNSITIVLANKDELKFYLCRNDDLPNFNTIFRDIHKVYKKRRDYKFKDKLEKMRTKAQQAKDAKQQACENLKLASKRAKKKQQEYEKCFRDLTEEQNNVRRLEEELKQLQESERKLNGNFNATRKKLTENIQKQFHEIIAKVNEVAYKTAKSNRLKEEVRKILSEKVNK